MIFRTHDLLIFQASIHLDTAIECIESDNNIYI